MTASHYNNHTVKTVRAAAILTTSYVAGTVIDTKYQFNQMILLVTFTKGSLTSGQLKVEFSDDGVTYYQEQAANATGGSTTISMNEYTWTDTGNKRVPITIKDRFLRISSKGTGTTTDSSMGVKAVLGNV